MTHDDETRHIIEPDGLERRLAKDSRKDGVRIELGRKGAEEIARRLDPSWMVPDQEQREALAQALIALARKGRYAGAAEPRPRLLWQPLFQAPDSRMGVIRMVTAPGVLSQVADPYVLHGGEPVPLDVEEEARKIADLLGLTPDAVKTMQHSPGDWASPDRAERMLAVKALSDILNTDPRSTMSENTTQAALNPAQDTADEDLILDNGVVLRESGITADPGTLGTLTQVIEYQGAYWFRWFDDNVNEWTRHDNVDAAVAAYERAARDTYPLADPDLGYGAWTWTRCDVEGVPTQE